MFLIYSALFRQIVDERKHFQNSSQENVKQITERLQEIKQQFLEMANGEVKSSSEKEKRTAEINVEAAHTLIAHDALDLLPLSNFECRFIYFFSLLS